MHDPPIEDVAERFDAVYTRLTEIQKRLIAATRHGLDDAATRALAREASGLVAAVTVADRAADLSALPAQQIQSETLRARVLIEPIEGVLVMAAARSQARAYAYTLLAEVIEIEAAEGAWTDWTVFDVLVAPQHVGDATATRLARHAGLPPTERLGDLDPAARARLADGLREWADLLPAEASGRPTAVKLPEDGSGAGKDVLRRWLDPIGPSTDPMRLAARDVTLRDGWPADGIPVAELLVEFTHTRVLPLLLPGFDKIVEAGMPHDELVAALRAEERSNRATWIGWRDPDDPEAQTAALLQWALEAHVKALIAVRKGREQLELSQEERHGPTPLMQSRTSARRCGEILCTLADLSPDLDFAELLANLPPTP